MARKRRVNFDGAMHHVMNRGAGKRPIFKTDEDRRKFLSLLEKSSRAYGMEVHAWCLLDDRYHLLVRTYGTDIAEPMRSIIGPYTQWFNRAHETDGPLFSGRFRSELVDIEHQLLPLSRALHLSPLKAGLTHVAEEYRWSSYGEINGLRAREDWLSVYLLTGLDGETDGPAAYKAFVEREPDPNAGYEDIIDLEQAADRSIRFDRPSIDDILGAVASRMACTIQEVRDGKRGHPKVSEARKSALWIARRRFGYGAGDLAKVFGYGSSSVVSSTLVRFSKRIEERAYLRREIEGIVGALTKRG